MCWLQYLMAWGLMLSVFKRTLSLQLRQQKWMPWTDSFVIYPMSVANWCAVLHLALRVVGGSIRPKIAKNMIWGIWVSEGLINWTLQVGIVLLTQLILDLEFFWVVSARGPFASVCVVGCVSQAICRRWTSWIGSSVLATWRATTIAQSNWLRT